MEGWWATIGDSDASAMRLSLIAIALSVTATLTPPARAADGGSASRIIAVTAERTEPVGRFGGVEFERVIGHVEGHSDRSERIVGLRQMVGDDEVYRYPSAFEIIAPSTRSGAAPCSSRPRIRAAPSCCRCSTGS